MAIGQPNPKLSSTYFTAGIIYKQMKSTNFLPLEEALTNLGTSGAVSMALFSLQNRHTQALTCGMLALHHRTAGIYSVQNRKAVCSYKANKVHVSLSVELTSGSPVTLNLFQNKVLLLVKYWHKE